MRILIALAALVVLSGGSSAHAQAEVTRLPLVFHVAQTGDGVAEPVTDAAFLERQLSRANLIFAPYGVAFAQAAVSALQGRERMETRADRDALAQHLEPGVINCFVVASLRDVDEPGRMRSGVHWRSRGTPGAHYVILSASAHEDVLAHELGHFMGNPRHSDTPGNLMSYQRSDALPFLDDAQQRRMRRRLQAYLQSRELEPL